MAPHIQATPCHRSCCWNPWGTCARGWRCEHHAQDMRKASKAAAERSIASALENHWPDTRRPDGRRRP